MPKNNAFQLCHYNSKKYPSLTLFKVHINLHQFINEEECKGLEMKIYPPPPPCPEYKNALDINSLGIFNLAEAAIFISRLELGINKQFRSCIRLASAFSKIYLKKGFLDTPSNRPRPAITASVCIQKDRKEPWPLNISKKTWEGLWKTNQDHSPWLEEFNEYNPDSGDAVICEELPYLYWQKALGCGGNKKINIHFNWVRLNHAA